MSLGVWQTCVCAVNALVALEPPCIGTPVGPTVESRERLVGGEGSTSTLGDEA
jgi:hypothetical protein